MRSSKCTSAKMKQNHATSIRWKMKNCTPSASKERTGAKGTRFTWRLHPKRGEVSKRPGPYRSSKRGQTSKDSSNPASDKRIVRDMSNILKNTSRHSLEIASHRAKLRNIRLFEQPPTRNFETFVKKVRCPSKLSRRSPKVDFEGKFFGISPGGSPGLKSDRKS